MTHGQRHHGNPLHEHGHQSPKKPWWQSIHRDWRFWTGLILMVLAMVAYVLSVDESLTPTGSVQKKAVAAP